MNFKIIYNENRENSIFIYLVGLLLLAYYIGFVSIYVCLVVFLLRLVTLNRVELGFFSLLFGSSIFGRLFESQTLYIYSIVIFLTLGIVLLHREIVEILNTHVDRYIFFIILLAFFLLEFIFGPQTEYSKEKILKLSVRGILWITAFLVYVRSDKISTKRISIAFLIMALYFLSQSAQVYHIHPSSLFDFNFFRREATMIGRNELNTFIVNYHSLAYMALGACTLWIISVGFSINDKKNSLLVVLISTWIVIISGTRQGIIILGIVLLMRYQLSKGKLITLPNVFTGLAVITVFSLIISSFESSYFETIFTTEDVGLSHRLNRDTETPFKVMAIEPLFGVGFGGYPLYANKNYPHNFFLEIFCELGIVGFLFLLLLFAFYFLSNDNKEYINYLTKNNSYLILFFVVLFSHSQISGDMAESMKFITMLLAFVRIPEYDTNTI